MNPYRELANEIILTAVNDYKRAKNTLKKKKLDDLKRFRASDDLESIERFFRSGWFTRLTNIDGELILERLKNEM